MRHAARVPLAASLPPDAGRDASPAVTTLAALQALVGVPAERVPQGPQVHVAMVDGPPGQERGSSGIPQRDGRSGLGFG